MQLSSVVKTAQKAVIGLNGRVTRSIIYLTNLTNSESITLCMTPEQIKARTESNFRTWNIIEKGQVSLPKGERLTQISWQGIFPGANILIHNFVLQSAWQAPREIVTAINRWREAGDKVKVLVTQTPINIDTYIKSFDYEMSGGQGDIKYEIDLIAAKEMKVMTVEEADAARAQREQEQAQQLQSRAKMNRAGETVQNIGNAWELTQVLRGNGGDWQEVVSDYGISDPEDIGDRSIIWG